MTDDDTKETELESAIKKTQLPEEDKKQIEQSAMSQAGKIAMLRQKEMSRLSEELETLQAEYDAAKPTTPVGTPDWYVKWFAIVLAIFGVFIMSADIVLPGQIAYIISGACWIYVGMKWGDRAIMIGSAITSTAVAMNVLSNFT